MVHHILFNEYSIFVGNARRLSLPMIITRVLILRVAIFSGTAALLLARLVFAERKVLEPALLNEQLRRQ